MAGPCAFVALVIAGRIGPRLQQWSSLTASLFDIALGLDWFGSFWTITLDERGVVVRSTVSRRRVRQEDIRFGQAGSLLERRRGPFANGFGVELA